MGASFKIKTDSLKRLAENMYKPELIDGLKNIVQSKPVLALVAQGIADNFAQEGPGWPELKARTYTNSFSKSTQSKLVKMAQGESQEAYNKALKTAKRLERARKKNRRENITGHAMRIHDAKVRAGIIKADPYRRILQKTNTLYKSVTTPGAKGNFYRFEGSKLIWGTNLVYARIHNRGGVITNGFGKGIRISIPKREFLVLHREWLAQINQVFFASAQALLNKHVSTRK